MTGKDSVRSKILEAAKNRFTHYGYAKTTMAEVAAECGMSPGNLYRFFPGKLDIAEAIAREVETTRQTDLERLVSAPARSARDRLRDFLFAGLRETYALIQSSPRVAEISQIIQRENPKFAEEILRNERNLLTRLLREGNATGEFSVNDPEATAEFVQSATMKFRFPQHHTKTPLPELERKLEGVLHLIVEGMASRSDAA